MISKVSYGRQFVCLWLFRLPQAKSNRKLWDSLKVLSEVYRTLTSNRINVNKLERELQSARDKLAAQELNMQDLIGKVSFTYTSIENPEINPDLVIDCGTGFTERMRGIINNNAKL